MATVHGQNSRVHKVFAALVLVFVMQGVAACGDACTDLAKKICRCERTQNDQQACLQRIASDTSVGSASDEELQACNELNKTCTCSALAYGDLAACGLAKPTPGSN